MELNSKIDLSPNQKYWEFEYTEYGRVKRVFGKVLPEIPSGRILDLGCSVGDTTQELSMLYPRLNIIGIDINPLAVKAAIREYGNSEKLKFVVADGYKSPFPDETFDAIFCMNNISFAYKTWEDSDNLRDEFFRNAIQSIGRMVKDEGWLLISGEGRAVSQKFNNKFKNPSSTKTFPYGENRAKKLIELLHQY